MPIKFQPDDIYLYHTISALEGSATGDIALCVIESANSTDDCSESAIWAIPLKGREPFKFTSGAGQDSYPRWAPDGSMLAFISSRESGRQIHVMNNDGGEAREFSNFDSDCQSVEWSPDGRHLLATCLVSVESDQRGGESRVNKRKKSDADMEKAESAPRVCWRLPYKLDGTGFLLNTEVHLFKVDSRTGKHSQLTDGPFEVRTAAWSPNSQRVAFTRTREGRFAHRTDLWVMDADGGNVKQLSEDVASVQSPKWSPDGGLIVFAGTADEGDAQVRLWIVEIETGSVEALGEESIEVGAGDSLCWSEDGSQVYFILAQRGRCGIAAISVPEGQLTPLVTGDRQISSFVRTADGFLFVAEDPRTANDVYSATCQGGDERRLTRFNPWWEKRILPQMEVRTFEVPDGSGGTEQVEGWLLRHPDVTGAGPLLIDVHGGPASYVLLQFAPHVYWLVLVSEGWSVLALNAVGSSSYGRDFSARLRGHWGEFDLAQHLAAVHALQEEGLADDRVTIAGKSYGGYLAAWSTGNSQIFRAAVVSAPVANIESHWGTSDSGYYADVESMGGEPGEQSSRYQRLSPVKHAEKCLTPTLILQGEDDERCPRGQAEELFVSLMRQSMTPVEMVLYPEGSHHFLEGGRPTHRVDAVTRLVDWMNKWVDTPINS